MLQLPTFWVGAEVEELGKAQRRERVLPDAPAVRAPLREDELPLVVAQGHQRASRRTVRSDWSPTPAPRATCRRCPSKSPSLPLSEGKKQIPPTPLLQRGELVQRPSARFTLLDTGGSWYGAALPDSPSLTKRGQGRFPEIPLDPPLVKGERTPLLPRPFDPAQGEYQIGEV